MVNKELRPSVDPTEKINAIVSALRASSAAGATEITVHIDNPLLPGEIALSRDVPITDGSAQYVAERE